MSLTLIVLSAKLIILLSASIKLATGKLEYSFRICSCSWCFTLMIIGKASSVVYFLSLLLSSLLFTISIQQDKCDTLVSFISMSSDKSLSGLSN